jgi:hypothetical protein
MKLGLAPLKISNTSGYSFLMGFPEVTARLSWELRPRLCTAVCRRHRKISLQPYAYRGCELASRTEKIR